MVDAQKRAQPYIEKGAPNFTKESQASANRSSLEPTKQLLTELLATKVIAVAISHVRTMVDVGA